MTRLLLYFALALVPLPWVLKGIGAADVLIFASAAAAIAILAEFIRRATEQLAAYLGPSIGGLLTVSFGSIAELVLALSILRGGKAEVVQAQITGSILATSLLGLGSELINFAAARGQS